jgi:hypothetical protein
MLGILEALVSYPGSGASVGSPADAEVAAAIELPPLAAAARSFDGACYPGTCRSR